MKKTMDRIIPNFIWSGISGDVTRYCRSCDVCQKTRRLSLKVPLREMPLIGEPFQRVAVDLTGPIYPVSDNKSRYILMMGGGLRNVIPRSYCVAEGRDGTSSRGVVGCIRRFGFKKEILSDRGYSLQPT